MRLLIFCLLLALLTGCQPDPTTGTTTVEGQVVDSQSHKGVANATVQVYQAGKGGGHAPIGVSYPADAQGRFSFHFEAASTTGYALFANAPPGYFTPDYAAPVLTAGRSNTGLVVPMLAPAWVKLQLVDVPPKNRISLFISGYGGSGDQLYYPRDTTLIRPCLPNFARKVIWTIIDEKGISEQYSQDVNTASLDTVTVRIPF